MQLRLDLIETLPEYESKSKVLGVIQKISSDVKTIEKITDRVSIDNFYRLQEIEDALDEIIGYMV